MNNKFHISCLGSTLEQTQNGTKSSRSGSSTTNTRTITQAKANDPWGLFIVPFASGSYGIVFTDGVTNWNVVMDSTETVEDAVHSFLSKYYKYSLLPQQNENGTYVKESYGSRTATHSSSSSSRSGLGRSLFQKFTDAIGLTDHKGDEIFDAEYQATQYSINADEADYNVALSQGLLRTLSEVLVSFDATSKTFYLPYGYYYIGKETDTSPYYNLETAKKAKVTGDKADEKMRENEVDDWVNDGKANTPTSSSMSTKQKWLYALMALGTILYFTIDGDTKKKRKR